MAHRDSKPPHDEADPSGAHGRAPSGRSEWAKRLALFDRARRGEAASAYDSRAGEAGDWEEIRARPARPLPPPEDTPPLPRTMTSRLDPEREELELALAAAQRELADREAESVGLRGALGAAHQQLRAREAEITDLNTRLAVANATTHQRQDELEHLGGRYSGIEEQRQALEREVGVLRAKLQRAAEEAEKREIKIDNLRSTRSTLEETVEARDRIIRARDEELAACEQELQAHRDRIANQYKSVADRESEIAMLQDQLVAEQERARSLELEVGARDQMLDHQREKLAERDEQLANLLATFDVVERTIKTRPAVADLQESPSAPAKNTPRSAAAPNPPVNPDREPASDALASDESEESAEAPSPAAAEAHDAEPAVADVEAESDTDVDESPAEEAEPEREAAAAEEDADVADATDDGDQESAPALDADADADAGTESETDAESTGEDTASESDRFAEALHVLKAEGDLFTTRPAPQPAIFRWWRDQRIAQSLGALEVSSFDELLVKTVARLCAARPDDTIAITSLCGADATLELRLAGALEAAGHENYTIDCIDDREAWHDVRDELAADAGYDDRVDSLPATLDSLDPDRKLDVFIADGSLPCVRDVGALLSWLRGAWKDDSVMVIGSALGSCAASDAPEHAEAVDRIWNVMPDQYMHNHLIGSDQANYTPEQPASDAPGSGGPLAPGEAPLLPLLLDEFCFEVFAPFGNLINAFVGPEVGPNFDVTNEADQQFIETFAKLDEGQIDAGTIHPLHLVAVLRASAGDEPVLLEGRAPERLLSLGE